jgi:hypothetical protein
MYVISFYLHTVFLRYLCEEVVGWDAHAESLEVTRLGQTLASVLYIRMVHWLESSIKG